MTGILFVLFHGLQRWSARTGLIGMTVNTGVVTRRDFTDIGSGTTCGPHSMAHCDRHVAPSIVYPACPSFEYSIPSPSAWSESPYPNAYSDDKQCRERDYEGSGDAREEPGFLCFVLAFSTTESLNGAWSIANGNL